MKIGSPDYRLIAHGKDLPPMTAQRRAELGEGLERVFKFMSAEPIAQAARQRDRIEWQLAVYERLSAHADTLESDAKALRAKTNPSAEEKMDSAMWQQAAEEMRADIAKSGLGRLRAQHAELTRQIDSYQGTAAMEAFNAVFLSNGIVRGSYNV